MANIFDYLAWRGDIPFSADPFNEVDNLILSEMAYIDYSGIVSGDPRQSVPVREVCERYFMSHPAPEKDRSRYARAWELLPGVAGSTRFGDMLICNYVNRVDEEDEEQMAAVSFLLGDGTVYAAFRGTDNSIIGWKEDFNFGWMEQTAGQRHAAEYLNLYFREDARALRVGGHSKGGNFAVYASAFCEAEIQDRILQVYCNDGPGFREEITASAGYQKILPRITGLIPEEAVFGLLLDNLFPNKVVKSSDTGIFQHYAMSWQVERNRFAQAEETTQGSRITNKALTAWIENLDHAQRRDFIDAAYDLLSSSGAETFREFGSLPVRSYTQMGKALQEMEPEKQSALSDTILALVRAGADTLREEVIRTGTEKTTEVLQRLKEKFRLRLGKDQKALPGETLQEEDKTADRTDGSQSLYRVRPADTADIPVVAAIYEQIHTQEEAGLTQIGWARGVYPTRKTAEDAVQRNDLFVIQTPDGGVAGAAIINQLQVDCYAQGNWSEAVPDEQVLVLHTLVISPYFAGEGYGRQFVAYYEEYAAKMGCTWLRMDTNEKNAKARNLYKKLGYREIGTVPTVFNGIEGVQLVLLEKRAGTSNE